MERWKAAVGSEWSNPVGFLYGALGSWRVGRLVLRIAAAMEKGVVVYRGRGG